MRRGGMNLSETLGRLKDYGAGIRPLDISLVMTFILLMVYAENVFYVRPATQVLAGLGLVFYPWIGRSPWLWLAITAVLAWGHGVFWFSIDNHKYLMNYWTLAVSICLFYRKPSAFLAVNGRLLIGLCFLFATVWKAVTIEFVNGSFFEYLLIGGDVRFEDFSILLTGISPEVLEQNRELLQSVKSNPALTETALEVPPRVSVIALLLTWWTLIVEGLIAVLFLWPNPGKTRIVRDLVLGAFIISTYPVASVIGFAWLLVSMGTAQITRRSSVMKLFYIALFIVLTFFSPSAQFMFGRLIDLITL